MIQQINYFITRVFDIFLYPFSFINEFWGILFLSILMSFVVLWIYKWVSSPHLIRAAKDQIKANIMAIRLYKDSGIVIILSFFKSLLYTFKYFGLNFLPLFVIIPILFPLFVQMDIRYGIQPFRPGDEMAIKVKLNKDLRGLNVQLLEDEHYKPKMSPVFIKALKEADWKLEALEPGAIQVKIKVGDRIYEKNVWIGKSRAALSNLKLRVSSLEHFISPAESLLPGSGDVDSIYIRHPGREITFAGITTHWLVYNLILVIIVVLAFKNRFGIEF
jgi:hypothetical protein